MVSFAIVLYLTHYLGDALLYKAFICSFLVSKVQKFMSPRGQPEHVTHLFDLLTVAQSSMVDGHNSEPSAGVWLLQPCEFH